MPNIRVLSLTGSAFEMGFTHGIRFAEAIQRLTRTRLALCQDTAWVGSVLPQEEIITLAKACVSAHYDYAPDLMEEIEGIASATDIPVHELLVTNGFTDFADVLYAVGQSTAYASPYAQNCTTFTAQDTSQTRAMNDIHFIGQTWDMHQSATPYVVLLKGCPQNHPEFMMVSITGCVGMFGMNESGISICINNLSVTDGRPGVTWPFVVRKVLQQETLEDALACITQATLAGAHNYLLMDRHGCSVNVEATPTVTHIHHVDHHVFAHANICLSDEAREIEQPLEAEFIQDSTTRKARVHRHFDEYPVDTETVMNITRDRQDGPHSVCAMANPPYYSETCSAAIMRPDTGDFWVVWGKPNEHPYEHFLL